PQRRERLANGGLRGQRPAATGRDPQDRRRRLWCGTGGRVSPGAQGALSTLVFLEHHEGELQKDSLGVLGKAAQLGGDVATLIAGSGVEALAAEAGKFGAKKVFVADDPALEAPLPQPRVDVLAELVRSKEFDTVLFAATVLTADVAAGLAARLDAGLNWDLVDLAEEGG